ncbi:MAG: multifunctional fatty acid oxidation complex subunit alpha [Planctomycetota bacterium]|nr:MAG: multifunctional fatty acid oxidation complex subunit alpha [Planctomycetota bacterium]
MPESAIRLSFVENDVAVLSIDLPGKGANVLSTAVLEELSAHLDVLEKRTDLAGLVIRSGKPGTFLAGADLREFVASLGAPKDRIAAMCQRGRKLFQRLSQTPFVTVAAIDGVCLGGGAELALWCDRRVMSDSHKTQFGLPEVKLGLFPGWGGTARLPRIAGLGNAVEIITGGESITPDAARTLGIADDVAAPEKLDAAALAVVRDEQKSRQFLADRQRWSGPIAISETELAFLGATASGYIQQQTKGQYPAPLAALNVLVEGATQTAEAACEAEAAGMAELFGSPVNAALLNVFFLGDRNKKDTGIATDAQPRPVKRVGVIGAGIMGSGIAAAFVRREIPTAIADAAPEALARGTKLVLEEVSYNKHLKGVDVERTLKFAPLVNATTSDDELAAADVVIEAVVENASVKRQVFGRIEAKLKSDAILATNTSTIPIAKLAEGLKRPEQFCGIHFFNPVRKMPLVEVIRGPKTSDETVATAVALAKQIGKSPIVVNDGPGFLVNRLLLPYMNEAVELLLDGAKVEHIERAAKAFGMPMGPFTLFDVVGLDTAVNAGLVMHEAFPDRTVVSAVLPTLIKAGRHGQKSLSGFFRYKHHSSKGEHDPEFDRLIGPLLRETKPLSRDDLTNRLFLPMVLEATRVLEEHIVRDVRDVDLGLIYGIGFPPFKGGLLYWADTLGAAKIVEMLKPYEALGTRMQPTTMLLEMARTGGKFYRP